MIQTHRPWRARILRVGYAEEGHPWPPAYGVGFDDDWPANLPASFRPVPDQARDSIADALAELSAITGMKFKELPARNAQIVMAMSDAVPRSGWAGHPGDDDENGDLWLDARHARDDWTSPYLRWLVRHELGHAMGLGHADARTPLANVMHKGDAYRAARDREDKLWRPVQDKPRGRCRDPAPVVAAYPTAYGPEDVRALTRLYPR